MSPESLLATVVIPTQNRRASVRGTLEALARQTCAPDRFEIVVAANACTDGTVESLRAMRMPAALQVLELPAPGAAAARNAGARSARGSLLIFLDDDIEPGAEFVEAHLEAHGIVAARSSLRPRVAIGYIPAALQREADLFALALRGWWESMFDSMREPGHRFAYTDLLTGNFSIPRDEFLRLGGFDERYRCHEDYEFGYRLIRSGASFVFAENARGRHTDLTRLQRACWRKREEGHADVQLARQYPELRPALPLTKRRSLKQRIFRWLAFRAPRIGDRLAGFLGYLLRVLEGVGARASWRRVLYAIFGYWYERGVADAGTRAALETLVSDIDADGADEDAPPAVALDVSDLHAAERQLEYTRPAAVLLSVGSRVFGRIPSQTGAEPLAGRHLRPILIRIWHRAYVQALIAEGRFPLLSNGMSAGIERADAQARRGKGVRLLAEAAPPRAGR